MVRADKRGLFGEFIQSAALQREPGGRARREVLLRVHRVEDSGSAGRP